MRHRALLAWRLPPRLSLWRVLGPRGCLDGAGAAQGGEGRLAAHALGVVPGGCQQRGRGFSADAAGAEQCRVGLLAQR